MRHLCSRIGGRGSICLLYMHCTRSWNDTDLVYWYARHLCLIDWGVYLHPIYMSCITSRDDSDMVYQYARHLCSIDCGVYLSSIYIYKV